MGSRQNLLRADKRRQTLVMTDRRRRLADCFRVFKAFNRRHQGAPTLGRLLCLMTGGGSKQAAEFCDSAHTYVHPPTQTHANPPPPNPPIPIPISPPPDEFIMEPFWAKQHDGSLTPCGSAPSLPLRPRSGRRRSAGAEFKYLA